MALLGIDAVVFGVIDITEAARFLIVGGIDGKTRRQVASVYQSGRGHA